MKIVVVGKSCSGKDRLSTLIQDMGYRKAIKHTSRPPRHYESDGVHYRFLDKLRFSNAESDFISIQNFNGWYYGLTFQEFENSEVVIMTPGEIESILQKIDRSELFIVYIDVSSRERIRRAASRGDKSSEIIRRYLADEDDFQNFNTWDYQIKNDPEFESFFSYFKQKITHNEKLSSFKRV